jgi:hypothetical protein
MILHLISRSIKSLHLEKTVLQTFSGRRQRISYVHENKPRLSQIIYQSTIRHSKSQFACTTSPIIRSRCMHRALTEHIGLHIVCI